MAVSEQGECAVQRFVGVVSVAGVPRTSVHGQLDLTTGQGSIATHHTREFTVRRRLKLIVFGGPVLSVRVKVVDVTTDPVTVQFEV
jgi:hypothetical protein